MGMGNPCASGVGAGAGAVGVVWGTAAVAVDAVGVLAASAATVAGTDGAGGVKLGTAAGGVRRIQLTRNHPLPFMSSLRCSGCPVECALI
jgi:hypothetical protein